MAVNYASWSVAKLKKEAAKIEKAINTKESRERKVVLAKLKTVAKQGGFELSELVGDGRPAGKKKATGKKATAKKRAKAAIKFKNPKDPTQTWTGRGRQPRWVAAHLDKGGKIEALKI